MDARLEGRRNGQAGIALVLALMALMLLTFLGLTLAATTSTELQIATNYRWSQQAFYNAEAGVEAAKQILASGDWSAILPPPRPGTWVGDTAPGAIDPLFTASGRNYENWSCDAQGNGVGFGRVLDDGTTAFADVNTYAGQALNGSFSLWVRRPFENDTLASSGQFQDKQTDGELVLVSEGAAPFRSTGSLLAQANRALRTIEVHLSRDAKENSGCGGFRGGQVGGGPAGAGFGSCAVDPASLAPALGLPSVPAASTTVR